MFRQDFDADMRCIQLVTDLVDQCIGRIKIAIDDDADLMPRIVDAEQLTQAFLQKRIGSPQRHQHANGWKLVIGDTCHRLAVMTGEPHGQRGEYDNDGSKERPGNCCKLDHWSNGLVLTVGDGAQKLRTWKEKLVSHSAEPMCRAPSVKGCRAAPY